MIKPKTTSRPVQKYGNRGAWSEEADHMRAHPNETFIVDRRAYPDKATYTLVSHVRNGGYVAFRPVGAFDAWVEREGENLEVIAVYTGEPVRKKRRAKPRAKAVVATTAPVVGHDSGSNEDPTPGRKRRTVAERGS